VRILARPVVLGFAVVLSVTMAYPAFATSRGTPHTLQGQSLAGSPVKFVSPNFASTGGVLPQHSSVGDFDGDGDLDAVTVNEGPIPLFGKGIGVSLGDGAGGLGATVTTDVGSGYGACDLAVGNWNGDAMDDLVVIGCVTSGPGDLVAFVATGGGHFAATQTWTGSDVQLAAGDFNGDGKGDFVTSENGSPNVRTYLGKGDGTFKAPLTKSPSFDSYDLETADFNNDGKLDLVGADGGPVWTMLGIGDGTFGNQQFKFSDVLTGLELAVADFNNDGNLDVAVVDASGGHVGVGMGTGDGKFTDGEQIAVSPLQVVWVAAGPVTNDGNADLVVGLDNDTRVSALLRGNGLGHFAKATHWVVGTAGLNTADFNADGRADLLSFVGEGRAYVSLAQGQGFRAARLTAGPASEDIVDVNGDGVVDKVSGTSGLLHGAFMSQVIVQLGLGDGRFGRSILSHVRDDKVASGIGDIAVADINEDGIPDVAGGFENFEPVVSTLFWMVGRGDGSFRKATLSDVGDVHADVNAMALADVNSDGHVDIVANDGSQMVTRLGSGHGTFGALIRSGKGSGSNQSVLVGDFTGDGVTDVVTTVVTGGEDFGSGEIRLQKGNDNGTFSLIQTANVDSNLSGGAQADFNGDGRPDVVTAGSAGFDGGHYAMWVLLTTASGALGAPTRYLGPSGQVATGDVDLDGDTDIATSGNATVDFYLNNGAGMFPKVADIVAAGGLGTMADVNGDGAPDVLSGSSLGEFAVHLNAR
jgi:FG-GAP-like repeat